MPDATVEALDVARREFALRLDAITPADWARPTPCGQWTVRQVVNHIVGHEHRFADNIATNSSDFYLATADRDFLGGDPRGAWEAGVAALDAAIAGLDQLDAVIQWRLPVAARDLLTIRIFEAVVHTWDVSRAIGFDEHFDERSAVLTIPLFERLVANPAMAAFFDPATPVLGDTSPQIRLLRLAGRRP